MKLRLIALLSAAVLAAPLPSFAQIIQLNATINAAQEASPSTSVARGTATMLYNVATNTYDLAVSLTGFASTLTGSTISQGAAGAAGTGVVNLGSESFYARNGAALTTSVRGQTYAGTPLTLLQNGAFLNFTSGAFPNGEIRGQLIAQPIKMYAIVNGAQETPPNPSAAWGASLMTYDPGTNKVTLRVSIYNFTNTLTNSHFHDALPGIAGSVVLPLGPAAVYTRIGNSYHQVFSNLTYTGNPLALLTGGSYINFHSNVYSGGEIRGLVQTSAETPSTRFLGAATRGFAGNGDQTLITGFVVTGAEPVLALITVRGPSLAPFGVTSTLADPQLALYGGGGPMLTNDDFGTGFDATNVGRSVYMPLSAKEAAIMTVLAPGGYTAVASGTGGATGTVMIEGYDMR